MSASEGDPGGPATLGPKILLGVVFDLDGTLIDSRLDIAYAANHALTASGRSPLSVDEISSYVGDGARLLLARAARLQPGAYEALAALAAFAELPLAICTNKPRSTTNAVLANLRFPAEFKVVVAGGDLAKNKPDPLPLVHIARHLGLSTAE